MEIKRKLFQRLEGAQMFAVLSSLRRVVRFGVCFASVDSLCGRDLERLAERLKSLNQQRPHQRAIDPR
jgi:hypothetical protein